MQRQSVDRREASSPVRAKAAIRRSLGEHRSVRAVPLPPVIVGSDLGRPLAATAELYPRRDPPRRDRNHQAVVRRRSDEQLPRRSAGRAFGAFLSRAIVNRGGDVSGLRLTDSGILSGLEPSFDIPTAYLTIAVAFPLALLLTYAAMDQLPVRDMFARRASVTLTASRMESIVSTGLDTRQSRDAEPLGVDSSAFEQIRRIEYIVKPGDTISEIALEYGLRLDTIMSVNAVNDVRRLLPGTALSIPNRDGIMHAIGPGESLSAIGSSYGVPVSAILDANDLRTERLSVGDSLFIPGARMEETQLLLAIGELLQWPVRRYRFTSTYGMRVHPITGLWSFHNGVDLAGPVGTPVVAARSGRVVHIENDSAGYGKMVIIDHGGGFRTLYAHLDAFRVSTGQYVSTGQQIGTMGNTGRSTGSHLHFSVIHNSRWEDPMKHLR